MIRREAREALRIVTPKIGPRAKPERPGAGAKRRGPSRGQRSVPSPTVQAVPKGAGINCPSHNSCGTGFQPVNTQVTN
ncbi:MAG: hypothetical protein ACE5I3_14265, partial [Phycisphaerae bacterium]